MYKQITQPVHPKPVILMRPTRLDLALGLSWLWVPIPRLLCYLPGIPNPVLTGELLKTAITAKTTQPLLFSAEEPDLYKIHAIYLVSCKLYITIKKCYSCTVLLLACSRVWNKNLCTGGTYYVPFSCLLISNKFCNGGERLEQGEQVPLCTCSSTPLSMVPETSLVGSCA